MVQFQSITINGYKTHCFKYTLLYAFHPTPFGRCLIAITESDEAVAYLVFVDGTDEFALEELMNEWSYSKVSEDAMHKTTSIIKDIFEPNEPSNSICVLLKGTEFQTKVWKSLTTIPKGTTVPYLEVARMNENFKAVRAIGNAISKNLIAYIVPCHCVKGKTGSNKYAWGVERKEAILNYERTERNS